MVHSAAAASVIQALELGDYQTAIAHCHDWLTSEPGAVSAYWYLGVAALLDGNETLAQSAWLEGLMLAEDGSAATAKSELIQLLKITAAEQAKQQNYSLAWVLYRYLQEFNPEDLEAVLHMAQMEALQHYLWTDRQGTEAAIALLQKQQPMPVTSDLLVQTLQLLLQDDPLAEETLAFATACTDFALQHLKIAELQMVLHQTAVKVRCDENQPLMAVKYGELCLRLDPDSLPTVNLMASLYQGINDYSQALTMARQADRLSHSRLDQIFTKHLLLLTLMGSGSHWAEVELLFSQLQNLIKDFCAAPPTPISRHELVFLPSLGFLFPHFRDYPQTDRPLMNQLGQICCQSLTQQESDRQQRYQATWKTSCREPDRPLKIGYLSSCFRTHPVGFLARGLLQHHDCHQFQPHLYFVSYKSKVFDPIQHWYESQGFPVFKAAKDGLEIAEQIHRDGIDILIDLDSITIQTEILALKPAPIQATWLGFDAAGCPAVDYFIADPYVLPEQAQAYYGEKIWRLPQTYLAIDGLEVGLPTLRREDLGIPADAPVYFSSQRGNKRNPHLIRLQMQILKAVPGSYFLIKGQSDQAAVQEVFLQMAEAEGISVDRLKFPPLVNTCEEHRANLRIANIILDTYPYNGATTTLEALWMEVPVVTLVGQQFSARNSYTFLSNAGVTEGIAWSDAEYVEWGVRLGQDQALRDRISLKLKAAKQRAPLWDARKFTREMETAYQSMWKTYLDTLLP
uniref:TPR repeat-containing protein n=1 Tax=Cyanothece sp. (strain PCC 7425 / ATCC 29141) TaxID=395961 RepID=B8HX16_CYAP4